MIRVYLLLFCAVALKSIPNDHCSSQKLIWDQKNVVWTLWAINCWSTFYSNLIAKKIGLYSIKSISLFHFVQGKFFPLRLLLWFLDFPAPMMWESNKGEHKLSSYFTYTPHWTWRNLFFLRYRPIPCVIWYFYWKCLHNISLLSVNKLTWWKKFYSFIMNEMESQKRKEFNLSFRFP